MYGTKNTNIDARIVTTYFNVYVIIPPKHSLRTQTYFRLSLVSAENSVCEPEPGNDFCDVMTFVSPWPMRFYNWMKLECSSQRIPRAVVLGLLELNCDWLKIPTSQKSFPSSGSQTLFSAETSDSRKYVCVRRLTFPLLWAQNLKFLFAVPAWFVRLVFSPIDL